MPLRIVLMGTGEFALPSFHAVIDSEHTVVGLFTQPDRTGRGHHQHVNPLKELAISRGIPVFQPERVNRPEGLDALRSLNSDVCLVAAYGQILKPELLSVPRLGFFNLHGSLLPRHRGAAPVQYSIWCGDSVTGVTIFRIEPSLDSGPIIGVIQTPIGVKETSGELMLRLAELAVPLTQEALTRLADGTATYQNQDAAQVTLAPKISREQGVIDWNKTPREIDCHIRAMQPWPRASTMLHRPGQPSLRCLVQEVEPAPVALPTHELPENSATDTGDPNPGGIRVDGSRLLVQTARGSLEILRIQPDGSKSMDAIAFLNGYPIDQSSQFA